MRKITVFDFCSQIGAASEEIPVVVKAGMREIGRFRSLYKIPAQAMPGVLEAKITYVTMGREEIIIQVALKDYNTKLQLHDWLTYRRDGEKEYRNGKERFDLYI